MGGCFGCGTPLTLVLLSSTAAALVVSADGITGHILLGLGCSEYSSASRGQLKLDLEFHEVALHHESHHDPMA